MRTAEFTAFLDRLAAVARARDDVLGLVGFGSTADRTRADEWSDHDFAWITVAGAEDQYRNDLRWLPDADRIVMSVIEHHGGVKVLYDDGHRLEFGISDVDSFVSWAGAPADVIVGDDAVRSAAATVEARRPEGDVDPAREVRLMLTQLHAGVGRFRRGEVLSGSGLVRYEAVNHLVRAITARQPRDARLDPLDARRRLELVSPQLGSRLESAVREPIDDAALALIEIAEELLAAGWPAFPHAGVAAVRARVGWRSTTAPPSTSSGAGHT